MLEEATCRRLRLEDPPSLGGNREPVFVCAECGDLGCGAVTARISASKGLAEWSDFAWENTWEEKPYRKGYEDIGPFLFEFGTCRAALTRGLMRRGLGSMAASPAASAGSRPAAGLPSQVRAAAAAP